LNSGAFGIAARFARGRLRQYPRNAQQAVA